MNKTKKFYFLAIAALLIGGVSYGQTTTNDNYKYGSAIDVAYEVNFPMGNLANGAAASWAGTTARYELNLGSGWTGMLTTGYLSFAQQASQQYSAIPLMLGAKLHFTEGWYGMLETGVHFFSTTGPTQFQNPTEWGIGLGTGYEIPLSKLLSIDLSTKYQYNTDNLSYWNVRAGLMFKL